MNENLFITSDFVLICTLVSQGHPIAGTERVGDRRVNFSFDSTELLRGDIQDFWAQKCLIKPQAFHDAMRNVRVRIHDLLYVDEDQA